MKDNYPHNWLSVLKSDGKLKHVSEGVWENSWPSPFFHEALPIDEVKLGSCRNLRAAYAYLRKCKYPVNELKDKVLELRVIAIRLNNTRLFCTVPSALHLSYLLFYNIPKFDNIRFRTQKEIKKANEGNKLRIGAEWMLYKKCADRLIEKALKDGNRFDHYLEGFSNASDFANRCPKDVYLKIRDTA